MTIKEEIIEELTNVIFNELEKDVMFEEHNFKYGEYIFRMSSRCIYIYYTNKHKNLEDFHTIGLEEKKNYYYI